MSLSVDQLTTARMHLDDQGTSAAQSIDIQSGNGIPLTGTFTVTWNGQTTAAIPYGSAANVVQNVLTALSNVGVGQLEVNNIAPYTVYFGGTLSNQAVAMLTVNTTGIIGTPIVTILTVTSGGQTAFSDAELNLEFSNAKTNFWLMIAYCYDVLAGAGAKFVDYTAGQTSQKKSQIQAHCVERSAWYHQWANADRQFLMASLVGVPPRPIAVPVTPGQGYPSTLVVRPPFRNPGGFR